ncbi:cardiomyopathy-associated protein 5 isoform X2 [Echeneis naucrates]|uniref:cardiomyopathy-associated protein 5 isoform X2 n=1 Tax=Echeneis naucrates TaxID=173247 RepID=UPI001113E75B|nr:cardiomyopathy-associated protein 5-like isoform X2 [Echeneis naucrates]
MRTQLKLTCLECDQQSSVGLWKEAKANLSRYTTMDALAEDFGHSDADAEMTALTPEEFVEPNVDASDEVENLRNSLREAVRDDDVRPKMQCLMMDASFSMVTMQGEDSGIEWETTPSRCNTPWGSEAGNSTADISSPIAVRSAKPGPVPAGKIIFVMDEELISRQKKTKAKAGIQRRRRDVLVESSENISGRPELVEVSEPNVKTEEGAEEYPTDPLVDKEQRLFSLVSEGFEILNIIVPSKLATVDEEESREMVDNLSYLEDSPVPKTSEETDNDLWIPTNAPMMSVAVRDQQMKPSVSVGPHVMDPPGAPVPRPLGRGAVGNVDYFEAFTLIDAQAPGSPAVTAEGQVQQEEENTTKSQESEIVQFTDTTITTAVQHDRSDTVSLGEITSELLDEVFYGGTDNCFMDTEVKGDAGKGAPLKLPSKPSGSTLFGSQEDILTPIFLPEGPPKIIDPILLEEPKAMAFLYTDLYEEAIGSRQKEEDTESMASEKSFHSRHSDREARGYLEKYVLIDETPAVDVEPTNKEKSPEEASRTLPQDLYDFEFLSKPGKGEVPNSEEEITDFFRSSANSSPCDVEPFPRTVEEENTQSAKKSKAKSKKSVCIKVEKVPETPGDPLSISSFEFLPEESDWGNADDHLTTLDKEDVSADSRPILWQQELEMQKPVAPPRKRAASAPKACLDLTPLTPVDVVIQEQEEAGGKEQREEEKETASPAETADEEDGDADEAVQTSSEVSVAENTLAGTETVKDSNKITVRNTTAAEAEETHSKTVEEEERRETEEADIKSDVNSASTEPSKDKRQCIIL